MHGLMMNRPLQLGHFLERANLLYPNQEIVSKMPEGIHRTTYAETHGRVRRLAKGLDRLGVGAGERVATFAWNHFRHYELYFAVPSSRRVLHTLNIRLFPDQVTYIVNHAEDRVIFVDDVLVPVLEKLTDTFKTVKHYVVMGNDVPKTSLPNVIRYEELIDSAGDDFDFPVFDENEAAAMCYTSGTTGNPKGVVYSHRALFLQSLSHAMADTMALSERDSVLAIVPMFHVNAWCLPFSATMVGAKQVYPHQHLQPEHLVSLIRDEKVTFSGGVPTIWTGVLDHLDAEKLDIPDLRRAICGGSAVPVSLIDRFAKRDICLMQAWGMTETSPLATVARVKPTLDHLEGTERLRLLAKQGLPIPCVELRVVDDQGNVAPRDGKTMGELEIRGPWVIGEYYEDERSPQSFDDGWFRTGDVATLDAEGYMHIQDRAKDVIKSGGEWVSSVELENAIMGHPKVAEAAVIGVPHPKWEERPLACVVPREEHKGSITKEEIIEHIRPHFAKWWLPEDVVFVESIPKTSVGKFSKRDLRTRLESYKLPT